MLAVAGGGLGSLLIHLNVKAAVYRKNSIISQWPLVEVLAVAGATAFISYPVSLNLTSLILILILYQIAFMRVQSSELVVNLFQECDPSKDFHGLCEWACFIDPLRDCTESGFSQNRTFANIFLLLMTAALKMVLTAWTFGIQVRHQMVVFGLHLPFSNSGTCWYFPS